MARYWLGRCPFVYAETPFRDRALGGYGVTPPGQERLVLGHESIGEVIDAPEGSGLEPGNLVVGIGTGGGAICTLRSLRGRRMGYVPKRALR